MNLVLTYNKTLKCAEYTGGCIVGYCEENKSTTLSIKIFDSDLRTKWAFLEFQINNGDKYTTGQLDIDEDGVINYTLPNGLLYEKGTLYVQLVFRYENDWVKKSSILKLEVKESICAGENSAAEFPDFINESVKVVAECKEMFDEITKNDEDRKQAEALRQLNELDRISKEQIREQNEATRIANEQAKVSNENERIAKEQERVSAEETRQVNEETRIANESVRETNETTRQVNESSRNDAEALRVSREQERQNNENTRIANENTRAESEATRNATVTRLEGEFEAMKTEMDSRLQAAIQEAIYDAWEGEY